LFFPGNRQLLTLVLQLTSLKKEGQRDADERHTREEHANWFKGLSDLRPSGQCPVVGAQQQDGGQNHAGRDERQTDRQRPTDG
jgi:hypothetical protein